MNNKKVKKRERRKNKILIMFKLIYFKSTFKKIKNIKKYKEMQYIFKTIIFSKHLFSPFQPSQPPVLPYTPSSPSEEDEERTTQEEQEED